jgi:NitT/TauT family transport system ATP-binding protein
MQAHLLEIWRKIDITIVFITHDLEEAIFLADRILVLSAHPGQVQELIEVPVPRPRSTSQIISPEFLATKARLEELIHGGEAEEDGEDAGTYQMVARLTDVTDEVE